MKIALFKVIACVCDKLDRIIKTTLGGAGGAIFETIKVGWFSMVNI